jgi:Domain of unknown function (DUF6456)
MNKNENDWAHQNIARQKDSMTGQSKSVGNARRTGRRARGGANNGAGDSLNRDARRLLTALGLPDARVFIDPTDEASVILHRKRSGISIGAGRFSLAVADYLMQQDLALWEQAAPGPKTLSLTESGRAHLRRANAPEPDTAFFHQHRETAVAMVETGSGAKRVRIDTEESPLDWLRRRRGRDGEPMIDEASYQAGERLRTDIMLAGLLPGVTARWDAMPRSGGPVSPSDATDRMIAARQRIRNAFDAVGADFSDLLMDLCGFLKGLELIERERRWPPRSAKIVVRMALARLAEHYGIESAARGPAASRGIRAWQAVVIDGGRV